MTSKLKTTIMLIVLVVCLTMIIVGQKSVGYQGLMIEIIGLVGLLIDLFIYNKDHK